MNNTPWRPMENGGITPHVPNFFSGLMYWSWFIWKVEWFVNYGGCKDCGRKGSWPVWELKALDFVRKFPPPTSPNSVKISLSGRFVTRLASVLSTMAQGTCCSFESRLKLILRSYVFSDTFFNFPLLWKSVLLSNFISVVWEKKK